MGASYVARPERSSNPLNQERKRLFGLFASMTEQAKARGVKRYYKPHSTLHALGMPAAQIDVLFGQQLLAGQRRDSLHPPVGYELVVAKLKQNQIEYDDYVTDVEMPLVEFFTEQQLNQRVDHYLQACIDYAARTQLVDQHLGGRLTDYAATRQLETAEQRRQTILGFAFSLGQQFQTEYDRYQQSVTGSLGFNIAKRPYS